MGATIIQLMDKITEKILNFVVEETATLASRFKSFQQTLVETGIPAPFPAPAPEPSVKETPPAPPVITPIRRVPMRGGSYDTVLEFRNKLPDKDNYECHHILYKSVLTHWYESICENNSARNFDFLGDPQQRWGPTILMTAEDHSKTLSYYYSGDRSEVLAAIKAQEGLVLAGDIVSALKLEMRALHCIFGDKYDIAIDQAASYFWSLRPRTRNAILSFDNPVNHTPFTYDFSA